MAVIQNRIDNILNKKKLSRYELNKMVNYYESDLNKMIKGQKSFPSHLIEKLLPILEVSREEFESLIVADKYSKEVIQLAIESKKAKNKDKKLIITAKIDEILELKALSRTTFSKLINHSQSGLNRVIIGKEPLSKNLMTKISTALEIPIENLQAYVLADKYSLKILELAIKEP